MLVLSRRRNEKIIINDDIVITVSGIHQASVSIGIDAPKEYSIHREEIYNKINENKKNEESRLVDSILNRIHNLLEGAR